MSFLSSRSHSSSGHHRNSHYGRDYYKRTHGSGGGVLGAIFRLLFGSKRHSRSRSYSHGGYYNRKRHKHSSWS